LKLRVAVTFELVAWILQWGSFGLAISPPKLVEMVKTEVDNLQRKYSSSQKDGI